VSEGTVSRHRAAINEGRFSSLTQDEEEGPPGYSAGGAYHSQYFRDAAESLLLRTIKHRAPGRGFEMVDAKTESPLARGAKTRYGAEIRALEAIVSGTAEVPARPKPGPVYLSCKCSPAYNGSAPRQIRMANGPGRLADRNEDTWCKICDHPFRLAAGSINEPGFPKGASPGRPRRS
jgi:hypothetical protein